MWLCQKSFQKKILNSITYALLLCGSLSQYLANHNQKAGGKCHVPQGRCEKIMQLAFVRRTKWPPGQKDYLKSNSGMIVIWRVCTS